MSGFIQGEDRFQATLFPERLDDYVAEDSAVRVIDVFIDELDLSGLGFKTQPNDTGRPAYHPSTLLKLYVYGYLNRVQSSRRLEREAQRNVELMWLTGRLAPDFKTIADFRKDNGVAIRLVCREFVVLCRNLNLFANAFVAIDGSKFKAVNNRDRNFTRAKMKHRLAQVEVSIDRYLRQLADADRTEPAEDKSQRLEDKIAALKQEMARLKKVRARMLKAPGQQISLTDPDARSMATSGRGTGMVGYNVQTAVDTEHHLIVAHEVTNVGHDRAQLENMATQEKGRTLHLYWASNCQTCKIRNRCTTGIRRKMSRWEHEAVLEEVEARLDRNPQMMRIRRSTVEHPFGTLKAWMGSTHFLMKTLPRVNTEMSLHVLAYNLKRMMNLVGTKPLIEAIRA